MDPLTREIFQLEKTICIFTGNFGYSQDFLDALMFHLEKINAFYQVSMKHMDDDVLVIKIMGMDAEDLWDSFSYYNKETCECQCENKIGARDHISFQYILMDYDEEHQTLKRDVKSKTVFLTRCRKTIFRKDETSS